MNKLQGISEKDLKRAVLHYEKMGKTYFWRSPGSANQRRYAEKVNYCLLDFVYDDICVTVRVEVTISCRHWYIDREVVAGGVRIPQGLRYLKRILKEIDRDKKS